MLNISGLKEAGGKQGVLAPQAVPLALQHAQVAQVVEGPQKGGEDGQNQKGDPDGTAPAFEQLSLQASHQHQNPSFLKLDFPHFPGDVVENGKG